MAEPPSGEGDQTEAATATIEYATQRGRDEHDGEGDEPGQDDLAADAVPRRGAQPDAEVADVTSVPRAPMGVAEHAAGEHGVEELGAVVRGHRDRSW